MILKQKISNIMGPSGIFAGYVLFFAGLGAVYFTLTAIPVVLLGAVLAFSTTRSTLDLGSKRYRIRFFLAGVIPFGKWEDLDPEDQVSVRHLKGTYSSFSAGNRRTTVGRDDFLVILSRHADRKNITLACFATQKEAIELSDRIKVLLTGD
ncbi:MAG: hypothetical protein JW801_07495 [Bacteroidales bacterium]|nr:hypothetical protein [Bacteroidales bacterium]